MNDFKNYHLTKAQFQILCMQRKRKKGKVLRKHYAHNARFYTRSKTPSQEKENVLI